MDGSQFDAWTRRRFGMATGGAAAAALLGLMGLADAAARHKNKHDGNSNKNKNKNKQQQQQEEVPEDRAIVRPDPEKEEVLQQERALRPGVWPGQRHPLLQAER